MIIAELGINHEGRFDVAQELIRQTASSGADGIKFQYRNLRNAYASGANQIGDEMLLKEISRNYLSPDEIVRLSEEAHQLGLQAGISFFDASDLDDFKSGMQVFDFFKAPSVELNNTPLVNLMLSQGKPVYLSLGCHYEHEIKHALSGLQGDNWMLLHCVSNYPVSLANSKLGYLKFLSRQWPGNFGYSSHDENWEVCLMAMAMGARVIERHITFDKKALGLDHSTSSTPDEFKRLTMFAKNMDLILAGDGPRVPNQGEFLNLQNLGRSYYAIEEIQAGEIIREEKLSFHSPRIGLGRVEISDYLGQPAVRTVKSGSVISRSAFVKAAEVSDEAIEFARSKRFSIPVRLHDINGIEERFPIGAFEFHLSFGEALSEIDASGFKADNHYSIHLPDYINPTELMDPFSASESQRKSSRRILQKTVDFAKSLQDRAGSQVPIVGSFSVVHKNLAEFYEQHAGLFAEYGEQGVVILPQWLPPIAWYFGGSVRLEVMNDSQDVDFILKHNLSICMDVCHLCLGDSLQNFGATNLMRQLAQNIQHLHIADAAGVDGEGLHFGEGDPKNMSAIEMAMDFDCMKVIEVWQGHLDEGAGFAKALNDLNRLFNGRQ